MKSQGEFGCLFGYDRTKTYLVVQGQALESAMVWETTTEKVTALGLGSSSSAKKQTGPAHKDLNGARALALSIEHLNSLRTNFALAEGGSVVLSLDEPSAGAYATPTPIFLYLALVN